MATRAEQIAALEKDWAENPLWKLENVVTAEDVVRLRGSLANRNTPSPNVVQKNVGLGERWRKKGYECVGDHCGVKRATSQKAGSRLPVRLARLLTVTPLRNHVP